MLLLLAVIFHSTPKVCAQGDPCEPATCSRLRVEVFREATSANTCGPALAGSCNYDRFNKLAYTVYLRHDRGPSEPEHFLNYEKLDVILTLNNTQFSHIDVAATEECFKTGIGAVWQMNPPTPNTVIFTPTEREVSISFDNDGAPDCGVLGSKIWFSADGVDLNQQVQLCPPGRVCYYAKLFTVIVNAYPEENISFSFSERSYLNPVSGLCNITTSNNNNTTTVLNPIHFTGTVNENIRAELGGISPVVGTNQREMPIILKNFGATALDISYLEFMVRAVTTNITEPLTYDPMALPPRVYTSGGGNAPLVTDLHFIVHNEGMLNPGDAITINKIIFKEPALGNQNWVVNFSFRDSGANPAKSRIKTTGASNVCTSLNVFDQPRTATNNGDNACSDPSIQFKIEGVGSDCGTSKVKVGLKTTAPPAIIRLSKVEFELEFGWSAPGISITGVNYALWPNADIDCGVIGCAAPPGLPKSCWTTAGGNTFKYCYETNDLNAPLFVLNDYAEMEILFNTPENACIESVKIKKLRITYVLSNDVACIPVIDQPTGFPLCGAMATMLTGEIKTEDLDKVENVSVDLSGAETGNCPNANCSTPCSATDLTGSDGLYQFSCTACTTCNKVKVVPTRNDNWLEGVTTYDLVLISKHILSLEPLTSPYKIIAADADKMGSITTFDIVTIRKLILGIIPSFPNNTSWRFVDADYIFPAPNDPFSSGFPEIINCLNFPSSNNDFVAIKVGDVNDSSMGGNRPGQRPALGLSWPNLRRQPGDVLSIPIRYNGTEPIEAIQLGLRFDPAALELIGPSVGEVETYLSGNFNLSKAAEGEIRTLWIPMTDAEMLIKPGSVLFHLNFKVLSGAAEGFLPLWIDHQLLDGAAWKPGGEECSLQQVAPGARRDDPKTLLASGLTATVQPNPASGGVTLSVQAEKADKCRVAVFDAFGQMLFFREFELREGAQEFPLPEVAPLPAGVYSWKVYTPSLETQGQLIKQ
ncbi:MAG: hypothetical protein JNN28_17230 [Saprospiraceae bacterium]|nr:hypothetical protein [Saprospiraceae bacterium]